MSEDHLQQKEAQIKKELSQYLYNSTKAIELRAQLRQIQLTQERSCQDSLPSSPPSL